MVNKTAKRFYAGTDFNVSDSVEAIAQNIGLDWTIKRENLYHGDFDKSLVNDYSMMVAVDKDKTKHAIDVIGSKRKFIQNTEILSFFKQMSEHYKLPITSIGTNNFDVFVNLELPVTLDVKKIGDITKTSLVIYEGRKNNHGIGFYTYFNRLVCTNGMSQRVKASNVVVSHFEDINMKSVDSLIKEAIAQVKQKETITEVLAETPMSLEVASLLLIQEFGDPTKTFDKQPAMVKTCLNLFNGQADGSEMLSAYQTAYGLMNSVTQYYRGSQPNTDSFLSVLNGSNAQKIRSFERVLVGNAVK